MEAKELMIGDWVKTNLDDILQVDSITDIEINLEFDGNENYGGTYLKEVEPIPLTEEILVKNGFEFISDEYAAFYLEGIELREREYTSEGLYELELIVCNKTVYLHYVHELQHTLRLIGINKEIEL